MKARFKVFGTPRIPRCQKRLVKSASFRICVYNPQNKIYLLQLNFLAVLRETAPFKSHLSTYALGILAWWSFGIELLGISTMSDVNRQKVRTARLIRCGRNEIYLGQKIIDLKVYALKERLTLFLV